MSGHAGDVIATPQQVQLSLQGILSQLGASGIADGYDSLSDALDKLNMWDFVHNQARVTAQYQAFAARDSAIINKLTMAGAYVKLDIDLED